MHQFHTWEMLGGSVLLYDPDATMGVDVIAESGCESASCNIRSASCFDVAAALAGICSLHWLCAVAEGSSFWGTCFSENRAGMVLVCDFSRLFPVEVASLFCLLIRAATKRLISFWFKSGTSFKRGAYRIRV